MAAHKAPARPRTSRPVRRSRRITSKHLREIFSSAPLPHLLLQRFPVIWNRPPSLPGRGRACPGHLDSACSALYARGRRDKPGDDGGMCDSKRSKSAVVSLLLERRKPKLAEEFTLPVASGVVAGGSLMGVVLVFWANGGSILNKLFGG